MIVCHCNGVTDRTIRAAIRDGANSRAEVAMACRAGRSCGGCAGSIDKLLDVEAACGCAASCDCSSDLAAAS